MTSNLLKNENNKLLAIRTGGGSSFITVTELPTSGINTSAIYKVIKNDEQVIKNSVIVRLNSGDQTIQQMTDAVMLEDAVPLIYTKCTELGLEVDMTDAISLAYFCCPVYVDIPGGTLIIGYVPTTGKYTMKFIAEETEFVNKEFDSRTEFENFYKTEEFQTCISEAFGASDDFYNKYLAQGKLNFKVTETPDTSAYLNFVIANTTVVYNNKYFIYNKEKWIEIKQELPTVTELGTAAVYDGTNWLAQTGYGIEFSDSSRVISVSWDGDTEGKETATYGGQTYYKILDTPLDSTILERGKDLWIGLDATNWTTKNFASAYPGQSLNIDNTYYAYNATQPTTEFTSIGLWLSKKTVGEQEYFIHEIEWGYDEQVLKFDEKFLHTVSVSDDGTATAEVGYITIDGIEKKLAGGTKVEANPTDTPSGLLNTIKIDDTTYSAVHVTANPTGTPSSALTAIAIDGTTYSIDSTSKMDKANPTGTGTLTMNADKFTVDANGNTSSAGTLAVTGITTLSSDLIVPGLSSIKKNATTTLFWSGTLSEYEAIASPNPDTLYIITDAE